MKKYILILLSLVFLSMLFSCGGEEESEISNKETESSTEQSNDEDYKTLITSAEVYEMLDDLLEKEKELVRLFFENGMYELTSKTAQTLPVDQSHEFSSIENVNELFDIYAFPEKVMPFFFGFPKYGEKAVFEKNGVVYSTKYQTIKLAYPPSNAFYISELGLASATLSFDVNGKSEKIVLDFETNTLSDSPYRLIYSEDYSDKWSSPSFKPTTIGLGSGKTLSGDTLVVNVFITDKKSEWDNDDVKKTLNELNESIQWISDKAKSYGVELNLTSTTETTSLYYRSSSNLTTEAEDQIWINEMFAYTTYGSLDEYIKSNRNVGDYDNYVVLFHLNKEGENNCGRYDSQLFEKDLYSTERAVTYSNSTKKDYVEAILYLFGAHPLDPVKSEIISYFGNEIMLSSTQLNNSATIGEITAYLIGWKRSVHSQLVNTVINIFK